MSLSETLEAQTAITEAVKRYHIINKAVMLATKNSCAGTVPLSPVLKRSFLASSLALKDELEGIIDRYLTQDGIVGQLASSKVLDVYAECLHLVRAFSISQSSKPYNYLRYVDSYASPKCQAREVSDLSLITDEFLQDLDSFGQTLDSE